MNIYLLQTGFSRQEFSIGQPYCHAIFGIHGS